MIPPHPSGVPRTRESFPTNTLGFDPISAASAAAQISVDFLLNPQRAERLIQYHDRNPQALGFGELLDKLVKATWQSNVSAKVAAVQRAVGDVVLQQLMRLASDEHASPAVRETTLLKLHQLREWAGNASSQDSEQQSHLFAAATNIRNFENGTAVPVKSTQPVEPPPGAPIGSMDEDFGLNR
jgi:hypothetical protein